MVFSGEATKIILNKFPDFQSYADYQECLERYQGEEVSFCGVMSAFTSYVIDFYLLSGNCKALYEVFDMIESFVNNGDQSVQDGAATCFLENLINISSHGDFSPVTFVPYLGKESKEYCKAWDKFTGVQTEGLWGSKW